MLPAARQKPAAHGVHAVEPAYAKAPTPHCTCDATLAQKEPAAQSAVSLAVPAGQ